MARACDYCFVKRGHYALDDEVSKYPSADIVVSCIGDLLNDNGAFIGTQTFVSATHRLRYHKRDSCCSHSRRTGVTRSIIKNEIFLDRLPCPYRLPCRYNDLYGVLFGKSQKTEKNYFVGCQRNIRWVVISLSIVASRNRAH